MATLRFATNQPQELRLRFLEGKEVESRFGGMQHMFTCEEGAFYVSDTVGGILAEQLRKLNIRAGEPVTICKREVSNGNGRKGIQWQVERVGVPMGEQQNGTFVVPSDLEQKLAASIDAARKPVAQAQSAMSEWQANLINQSCAILDCYAAVLKHAAKHDAIRGEDVRSIFLSTYINASKNGGRNAA